MKKYIIACLAVLMMMSMTSCRNNNDTNTGDNVADDIGDAARDVTDGIEDTADDITDGTMFDTDNNYNVDDYSANGDETK